MRFQRSSSASTRRNGPKTRLNVMILVLSLAFFILVAPQNTFTSIRVYIYPPELYYSDLKIKAEHDMVLAILNLLSYANNAINFLLYVLWGDKFRQQTKQILCCCCIYVRRRQMLGQMNRNRAEIWTISHATDTAAHASEESGN
ncbi:hypothetical protein ACF0H5_020602 [Mactra antiquata]